GLRALLQSGVEEDGAVDGAERSSVEIRSLPSHPIRSPSPDRGRSLARCEGFQVDSTSGTIGYVEGLRFVSRIDEPDLLEVRGGRFGRELMLIPVEAVEAISPEEERLVVRSLPPSGGDHAHELVSRVRRVLSATHHSLP